MKNIILFLLLGILFVSWEIYQETMLSQRSDHEISIQQAQEDRMAQEEQWFKEQERKIDRNIKERIRLVEENYSENMQALRVKYEQLVQQSQKVQMTQEEQWFKKQQRENDRQLQGLISMEEVKRLKRGNYLKIKQKEKHEQLMEQARKDRAAEEERWFKEREAEKDRQSKERIEKEKAKANNKPITIRILD